MRDRTGKRLRLVEETYPTAVLGIRLEVGEDPIALALFSSLASLFPAGC